jgi:hypothetical protein
MKLYYAEVTSYDEYTDKEETDTMFIFGETIVEASKAMTEVYNNIINFSLSEINSYCTPGVFYLPKDFGHIEDLKNANCY